VSYYFADMAMAGTFPPIVPTYCTYFAQFNTPLSLCQSRLLMRWHLLISKMELLMACVLAVGVCFNAQARLNVSIYFGDMRICGRKLL